MLCLEGVWVAEGSGRLHACLDDPTELPYARQMPCLMSSGHGHWQKQRICCSAKEDAACAGVSLKACD